MDKNGGALTVRKQSNFRLTDTARKLLAKIAKSLGVSVAGALEIAIREAAGKRGITESAPRTRTR